MELDRDTITQAALGDTRAFKQIYDQYSGFVYHVVFRMVGHEADAEDLTQEVFLTLYRKLGTFHFRSKFSTWVYQIALNLALNRIKWQHRWQDVCRLFLFHKETVTDDEVSYQKDVVQEALGHLKPNYRMAVVLYHFEGFSYDEIAKLLGQNVNTIRTWIKRGREQLTQIIKEDRDD